MGTCSGKCVSWVLEKREWGRGRVPDVEGWRMVGWSAAVFLVPVLGAIAGAVCGGQGAGQWVCGISGFGVGVGAAWAIYRWRRPGESKDVRAQ